MLELESNVQISTKIGKLLHISTFELDDVDKVEYWIGLMLFFYDEMVGIGDSVRIKFKMNCFFF